MNQNLSSENFSPSALDQPTITTENMAARDVLID